jgi:hypothetical protein
MIYSEDVELMKKASKIYDVEIEKNSTIIHTDKK